MIKVNVTRPCLINGQSVEVGRRLTLPPLQAGDMLDAGRAELVDDADMPAVVAARRQHLQQQMRALGGRPEQPPTGWPWHRMN